MPSQDYYEILGVSRNASDEEIKKAYRRLARDLHPDSHSGSSSEKAAAEERFKLVNQAYEVLKDPERRRQYDMFGADGERLGAAAGDPFGFAGAGFGDIFEAFFGGASPFGGGRGPARRGPRQGENIEAAIELDFAEAVLGAEKEITVRANTTCDTCHGSGARPGTTPVRCSACKGTGEVRRVRQSLLGQMVTSSPCSHCGGTGEEIPSPCPDCKGQGRRLEERSYTVEVPAGVDDGATLRLTGRGSSGPRGGAPGDLYLHLRVKPHPLLERDGFDLHETVHVSMAQAALGTDVTVETLEGQETVPLEPGLQSGAEIRLRGRGVPYLQRRGRGDLIVTIAVDTPTALTPAQEDLLRRFAAERGEAVHPPEESLLSRFRHRHAVK